MKKLAELSNADKNAGCLTFFMLLTGFILVVMSFVHREKYSIPYMITLFLSMASPLMFPIIAIALMRQVSKAGAGLLLVGVITLMLMVSVAWVFISDTLIRKELGEGLAVELIGAVFTAIAIVIIEQAVKKFMD